MNHFKDKYGEYALVTGASSGIGKEFAVQLASKGLNLVLVARRNSKLEDLALHLAVQFGTKVKIIAVDLLSAGALDMIKKETDGLSVGLVVLNAGMEVHGKFLSNNLNDEKAVLRLNAEVPMELAHALASNMLTQKRGGIIFVSSTFGHQAVPFFANYAASKAYVLALGQALNYELKMSGIDVMVLSPGLTKTEMVENMGDIDFKKMPITEMEVTPVVRKALGSLGKRQVVIPGGRNIFMDAMGKYTTPRWALTNMFGFLVSRAMK
ncbi:MAG: SDR family NAD(P)-dependent oxidoreductase [Cyclobacteriaceae bacterium]|nr:SDR family NAD(P)-dependent oxidoreductase [Cyclobacteriaceae bacterium]